MSLTKYYIYKRNLTNPFIYSGLWQTDNAIQFEIVSGDSIITRVISKESGITMIIDEQSTITRSISAESQFTFNVTGESLVTKAISEESQITRSISGESIVYEQ